MRSFVGAICLAVLAGCASLSGMQPPQVSVSEVSLGKLTLTEQRLRLSLRITNPNSRELALDGLVFRLEAGGRLLAQGVGNQAVVIPALGEGVMEVDASLETFEILSLLPSIAEADGQFEYRLKGDAMTRDFGRLPFSRSGRMGFPLGAAK